jgi:hypothetical protein
MLTLVDKDGPYQLPTGWYEVSTRQHCELDRRQLKTMEARASVFAGRSIQVNGLVADALAWALKPVPSERTGQDYPEELGQETYLQVETLKETLAAQPLHACFGQVYATFVARRWRRSEEFDQRMATSIAAQAWDMPITDTYPAVAHCMAQLAYLGAKYAALAEPDHTEAGRRAREAGSERLSMFKHFNVAYHYAHKMGLTLEQVYQLPFDTVAVMLLHDRTTAEIQDTLTQLNTPKSK